MNLKELAEHLGLSQTTVSRALNGFPEVGEVTRRRVVAAAEKFHYRPNAVARKLATGRAGAVGLVFSSGNNLLVDPIFADFLAGLADGLSRNDTDILVNSTRGDEASTYQRLARARSVDAVVLSSPAREDPRVALLHRLGLPVVVHGRTQGQRACAYLDIDNEGAFRRATEMLADLGHRRIALINGDTAYTFALHRQRGWRGALADRGLAASAELDCSGPMTEEVGYRAARRLLELAERPTAMLCSSIFSALGALRAIRDFGLAVGGDMSIVAHDDGLTAIRPETLNPPLTTTFSSIRAAGGRVAEIALDLLAGTEPGALQEVWGVDIVFRGSTLPPKPLGKR